MTLDIRHRVKPAVAILGRPNVGKSTLYNRLTRSRDALVHDVPGVTRDVKVGIGRVGDAGYLVVDTGGIGEASDALGELISRQALNAFAECAAGVLVVDGMAGATAADEELVEALRRIGKPLVLAVNKAEGRDPDALRAEFAGLGLGLPIPISAAHGQGIEALVEALTGDWPALEDRDEDPAMAGVRVAICGRPNVGKSTLANRMLGEERMITADLPGTTHDSVAVPLERHGRRYTLIDTAGMRRRARVADPVEKFSAIKALQAIDLAQVVVAVLDAREGVTEQDLTVLGAVVEAGRSLVVAVNKWDGLAAEERAETRRQIDLKLGFVDFAELGYVSALHGTGVGELFDKIDRAFASANISVPTSTLTELLYQAVQAHNPPLVHGRRIKLRYAHMGARNPPTIIIHGNQTEAVPESYRRYLAGFFRRALRLIGTPVRVEFKHGENPFKGRRNVLTQRQLAKRRRIRGR